ncbi:E3 ubiquitin-protein ligase RHF1A-like [Syzygium oleosum]|uniref:E3 ubiquitin-protein ligase RHF1A-like n=1 Tax=Syzygium oleosum TaxID=219896 RepID=UPI0024B944A7|nr:E3 ubiquitin-protein ligase RHF1A-like [Syzygium oleosum]
MANFAPFPSSSLEKPPSFFTASSSSSSSAPPADAAAGGGGGGGDDVFEEDGCSICLECFTSQDPATVTTCNHEYHLQCILEWSQRSKECPICWQLLSLKDPGSQELLSAVEQERKRRSRNRSTPSPTTVISFPEDFGIGQDLSSQDVSDIDERVLQHLAAAVSRAHYVRRRERQRSSGLGSSRVRVSSSPDNSPGMHHSHLTNTEGQEGLIVESSSSDLTSGTPICLNIRPQSPMSSPIANMAPGAAVNGGTFGSRILRSQVRVNSHQSPQEPSPPEISSFSESLKSKFSSATARYKESISKGTRGLKEKILARNSSVKELSKGVQREMSAGIAGVARIIERLDLTPKRSGTSASVPGHVVETSNFSTREKCSLEDLLTQSFRDGTEIVHNISPDAELHDMGNIPGRLEVIPTQERH